METDSLLALPSCVCVWCYCCVIAASVEAVYDTCCLPLQVAFVNDCIGSEVQKKVDELLPGQVLMLENTRFHEGETANDPEFAAQVRYESLDARTLIICSEAALLQMSGVLQLAAPADFFVMDAFGCAHRAHASTAGVTQFLRPAVAGLLLEKVRLSRLPQSHVEVSRLAVKI